MKISPAPTAVRKLAPRHLIAVFLMVFCAAGVALGAGGGWHYKGQVLYRANKSPVAGVLVELVEADDDGKPTDEVLGTARADAEGRFVVEWPQPENRPVALVVSAVRESAASGGDRRGSGYDIKTHRTPLGYLPHPSATKPNTVLIERRRPGRGREDSDDD